MKVKKKIKILYRSATNIETGFKVEKHPRQLKILFTLFFGFAPAL